jgi:ADP-ribose pyrophosphatase YjhB (NUDIX family)
MFSAISKNLNSVGVVIQDNSNRFLLQKRDQKNTIYFPGLWGLFGGACEYGEDPRVAAHREVFEELCIKVEQLEFFLELTINSVNLGPPLRTRLFYSAKINEIDKMNIQLNEGSEYKFFDTKELPYIKEIVPFDLSALTLFYHTNIDIKEISPTIKKNYNFLFIK